MDGRVEGIVSCTSTKYSNDSLVTMLMRVCASVKWKIKSNSGVLKARLTQKMLNIQDRLNTGENYASMGDWKYRQYHTNNVH